MEKLKTIALAIALMVAGTTMAFAQDGYTHVNDGYFHSGYHWWGMHLIWWLVWMFFLVWVFALPYDIPFQRKKGSAFDILQKRFAAGQITNEEYQEKKKILEQDLAKK